MVKGCHFTLNSADQVLQLCHQLAEALPTMSMSALEPLDESTACSCLTAHNAKSHW